MMAIGIWGFTKIEVVRDIFSFVIECGRAKHYF